MKIRNWTKFQHYNHRRPPWIKIYRDLLDDPAFMMLSGDASKMLVMCWLLASENDGCLPEVETIAFRTRQDIQTTKLLLSELNQWMEHDASAMLADCPQHATPESESESESESEKNIRAKQVRKRTVYAPEFDVFWNAYPIRKGKGQAYKAWQRVVRDFDKSDILAGAIRVQESVDAGADTRYIKHPATWLNAHGWEDEPDLPVPDKKDRMEIINELADQVDFESGPNGSKPTPAKLPGNSEPATPDAGRLIAAINLSPDRD